MMQQLSPTKKNGTVVAEGGHGHYQRYISQSLIGPYKRIESICDLQE